MNMYKIKGFVLRHIKIFLNQFKITSLLKKLLSYKISVSTNIWNNVSSITFRLNLEFINFHNSEPSFIYIDTLLRIKQNVPLCGYPHNQK